MSTGQLFQFFQDGFDYTSTSGLRFSTVSGSLRLQFRLLASGPRFEKISALRAASSLKKKGFITAFPFIKGLRFFSRAARGHFPL